MAHPANRAMRSRRIVLIIAAIGVCLVVPAGIVLLSVVANSSSPWFGQYDSTPRPAYSFSLTDHNGKTLGLQDLRGQVVLLAFGFTRCPSICPTTLGSLAAVCRKLPPDARERTKVVFVSLDERDTPSALKDYVPFFDKQFIGLTGSPADIGTTARAFGASFRKAKPIGSDKTDYLIDHTTSVYLVDPDGNFRILYRFEQLPETDKIADDIQKILRASKPGGEP